MSQAKRSLEPRSNTLAPPAATLEEEEEEDEEEEATLGRDIAVCSFRFLSWTSPGGGIVQRGPSSSHSSSFSSFRYGDIYLTIVVCTKHVRVY